MRGRASGCDDLCVLLCLQHLWPSAAIKGTGGEKIPRLPIHSACRLVQAGLFADLHHGACFGRVDPEDGADLAG